MTDDVREHVWSGRLHLGDNAGAFGDATFVGLAVALPVELRPFAPGGAEGSVDFVVHVEAMGALGAPSAPSLQVRGLNEQGGRWVETPLTDDVPMTNRVTTASARGSIPRWAVVRVIMATTSPPGLYDDFVLTRLEIGSPTHYADIGYRALDPVDKT